MLGMEMMTAAPFRGPSGMPGQFLRDVRTALEGELEAVADYAEMAQAAPNDQLRAIVMGIMGDESGHARTFLTILATCMGSGSSGGLG